MPLTHPGKGKSTMQIKNPPANLSTNAPAIASRLSGNDIGNIKAESNNPNANPQITPSRFGSSLFRGVQDNFHSLCGRPYFGKVISSFSQNTINASIVMLRIVVIEH